MLRLLGLSLCVGLGLGACADDLDNDPGSGGSGGSGGTGGSGGEVSLLWPCTEQGIRDAVTYGGGPNVFDCDGPTVVTTEATIEIDDEVILDGENNLTVDGNQSHPVLRIGASARVELRNLTIARGYAPGVGGGISSLGDLRIEGCNLVDNVSDGVGGAVYQTEGVLEITNTTISRNQAANGGGGLFLAGDIRITDSVVADNVGGGIYNGGIMTLTNSEVTANRTVFVGGGIESVQALFVRGSRISGNEADRAGGGIWSSGGLFVLESTIDGNRAGEGGGIYGFDASPFGAQGGELLVSALGLITLQATTVSNNTAQRGAGIYSIALRMAAWNNTISGNVATVEGGALYVGGTPLGASTTHLTANTIADNAAPLGSALVGAAQTAMVRFSANIVEGDCHLLEGDGTSLSLGSNIQSLGDSCGLSHPTDRVNVASEELGLTPLANNGGGLETHLPRAGSVAIDMIPEAQCGEVLPIFPLLDQRRVGRPQGLGCDVGAVEAEIAGAN